MKRIVTVVLAAVLALGGAWAQDANKPVTVSFMCTARPKTDQKDFYLDILPQLVKEKYPNITVTVDTLPTDQYKSAIKSRLAAEEGPDIFTWWAFGLIDQLAKADYVRDLSDLSFVKSMSPSLLKGFTVDGSIKAVPRGTTFLCVYYNRTLFAKAGIKALPADWPSFLADCKKLKDAGIAPIVAADKDWVHIQYMLYAAASSVLYRDDVDYDAKVISGKAKLTDPKWIEIINKMKTLYDDGYIAKGSLGIGGEQAFQIFNDGQAAMKIDGTWDIGNLTKKGAVDFERGTFSLPTNDAGKSLIMPFSIDSGLAVNKFTKNYDAVKKILEYWYQDGSPLNKAFKASFTPAPPVFGGVSVLPLFADYLGPRKAAQTQYFCNAYWPDGVAQELCVKFQEYIAGMAKAQDVAAAAERKLREIQAQTAGN
jgi:raffinose/stachyose/melibiose transport system substrate-binding protein